MQQGGSMDEFNNRRQRMMLLIDVAKCASRKQHQCGSQTFAAAVNDVIRYLVDQCDF